MMTNSPKSVRGLVRDLLQDDRPGKWTEPAPLPKEEVKATTSPPAPARTSQPSSGPVREIRKDHIDVPTSGHAPTMSHTEQGPTSKLDASCSHKWSYRDGMKFCWLCGGPAPVDERNWNDSPWKPKRK